MNEQLLKTSGTDVLSSRKKNSENLMGEWLPLRKENLKKLDDFHIFITLSSSLHGLITNQFKDLLPVGLLAQFR